MERTEAGLYVPPVAQEKPQQGTVVAVGNGRRDQEGELIPMELKIGDKVLFGKYDGQEIDIEGVEHIILSEEQVMGVIEE